MDNRREFLKKAALLAGSAGLLDSLPESIQKALSIAPAPGSTYLDAEHVVILMQENRSFDHCYGTLRGVRGFNDPRAITLPNQNKVWLQTNAAGKTYAPFRLNLKDTKATWMSSLPHSWTNQVDARNDGKYDRWLDTKASGHTDYAHMPLTLGYYDREDIPFYYALADAFTVCDQHFCSSLTGTTPNRSYLWSGTIREDTNAPARVRNEELDYDHLASWPTFPERLEDNGISWRVYQNEINLSSGLTGDEDSWLANFSDNPLEWFSQYNVKAAASYRQFRADQLQKLPGEIKALEEKINTLPETTPEGKSTRRALRQKKEQLAYLTKEASQPTKTVDQLSPREQALHRNAFATNSGDPAYRQLSTFTYQDGTETRTTTLPKGDILHQFRTDVETGMLPTVSWAIAPENFSDHPSAPWYGAWYLSEMLDILTKNPEVWKKTIFILTYDENDGYFDHVPPFVAPHPDRPETGLTSKGIDTRNEHVTQEQEMARPVKDPKTSSRASAIGLGYRVPLVIASPWSRGGYVCSEVFDHTSVLQFLEGFLSHKRNKDIRETNISDWRRTVCGDLTSVFRPYNGESIAMPTFVAKDPFIKSVHKAKFKDVPSNFRALSEDEIQQVNQQKSPALLARQESGTRPANALPYELAADGKLSTDKKAFQLTLSARNKRFGKASAGSPFMVYDMNTHSVRDYAVSPGDALTDTWPVANGSTYHFRVYGPNGFFREFMGKPASSSIQIQCDDLLLTPKRVAGLTFTLTGPADSVVTIVDNAYQYGSQEKMLGTKSASLQFNLASTQGWYDFSIRVDGDTTFEQRYAGRVETGAASISDPVMGIVFTT
ncbi:phosphocholine-specific phospholipase C [Spirosoma sp. KUDC1026]|uniref:phosphocholine-specific phospholipase C n=1 Tax=Spirosoma sp. KUDC1026 TaxID=2745947 RepID=UPI00159B9214|nr:phospholipase C, phosphocholine-specific [Spirosoma sp. KUDC1026]QKZ14701.1 phospholipase C, phosphocholine-specific [Spirosoma sp. KUDC1026]